MASGHFSFSERKQEYDLGINKLVNFVWSLYETYQPELVTVEGVFFAFSKQTLKQLSRLQGVLINHCIRREVLYDIIMPQSWQAFHGFTGKNLDGSKILSKQKKAMSIEKAKLFANRPITEEDPMTTDEADAIMMALYAEKKITVNYV